MLLNGSLPNMYFSFKPLNLIDCLGNQKAKFAKNIKKSTKIISSEAIWGIKLKPGRNVHSISLYKHIVSLWLLHIMHFGCYGNLEFPETYYAKNESWL